MPVDLVRDAAIDVLLRVFERGWFLDESVDKTLRRKQELSSRGRRFLTQLAYGTVRHRVLCDHALDRILTQPLAGLPPPIRAILRMGVFQSLFCDQVTFPAMVNTSVDLAKRRGHAGTARLVNAVLRRAPKSLEAVRLPARAASVADYLHVRYSMPVWLVARWMDERGETEAEALCTAFNRQAPVTARVNTLKQPADALAQRLEKLGYPVSKQTAIPEELTLADTKSLLDSKPFQEGAFVLQDPASMLAAHLMEPRAGERILDLCAAPGGKTGHLAQLSGNGAHIVAMDLAWRKRRALEDNVARLGLDNIHLVLGDGARAPFGGGFDRVLVDAPCSGLGTLRRHPDLKYRVTPEGIARLAKLQHKLLRSALRLCRPGGVVVYTVCTFTPEETRDVVRATAREAAVVFEDGPEWLESWRIDKGQYRTRPQTEALDGFFLTRFRTPS